MTREADYDRQTEHSAIPVGPQRLSDWSRDSGALRARRRCRSSSLTPEFFCNAAAWSRTGPGLDRASWPSVGEPSSTPATAKDYLSSAARYRSRQCRDGQPEVVDRTDHGHACVDVDGLADDAVRLQLIALHRAVHCIRPRQDDNGYGLEHLVAFDFGQYL